MEGKYTLERFAREKHISKASALNLLSRLKKENKVQVSGGGKQKRIYTITELPMKPTNGFFDIVNKYSPIKLVPEYDHYTYGKYTVEHAIIDGLLINSERSKEAIMYLFRHVNNWRLLFDLAKKHNKNKELLKIYMQARKHTKVKAIPKRYL